MTIRTHRPGSAAEPSTNRVSEAVAGLAVVLLLGACGGGGSEAGGGGGGGIPDSGSPPPAGAPPGSGNPDSGSDDPVTLGIDRSGIFYASIASFGSIVVGGIRYDIDDAQILIEGQPGVGSGLAVGDVALVLGDVNEDGITGQARRVIVDDILEGRIEGLDRSNGEFRMLSQRVAVTPDTMFDAAFSPRSIDALANGNVVEVSGFLGADGRVIASRVKPDQQPDVKVTGFVSSLDPGSNRFEINGLQIDYSSAQLSGFPGGALMDGDLVSARAPGYQDGPFVATSLTNLGQRFDDACEDIQTDCAGELEGYVSRIDSSGNFDVDGFPVGLTAGTEFQNGTPDNLVADAKVIVQGVIDPSRRLMASVLRFDSDDRPIEIEAPVQAINFEDNVITLLGIPVQVDARTRFEDFSGSVSFPFGPNDIRVGDYLDLVGRPLENGPARVLATRIEREDADQEVELQGFVESISFPNFTVLGVTIQTTAGTEFEIGDDELNQAEFFSRLNVGDLVEVEGEQVGESVILAEEVEVES